MITIDEIKVLLKISDDTQDDLIEALMPIVADDIHSITNNDFTDEDDYYALSDDLTFIASAAITCINGDDLKLLNVGAGDDIFISGSLRNDGFYPVESKTDSSITIASPFEVLAEVQPSDNPVLICIQKSRFPKSLKIPFAQMVGFHLENSSVKKGVRSESLGRYSVTFDLEGKAYPAFIYEALRPFCMVGMK